MPYVIRRARAHVREAWDDGEFIDAISPDTITVHEDERGHHTGLLDADGNEIWDMPETVKMGFHK